MQINPEDKAAVIIEIKAQLLQIDIVAKKTILVSEFLEQLMKKRQLQELLNKIQNES